MEKISFLAKKGKFKVKVQLKLSLKNTELTSEVLRIYLWKVFSFAEKLSQTTYFLSK